MSYLVLARKYRPKTFDEICGQEVSTGVLRGAIEEERVGHAYLFSGPRGTGKTTTARVFAKALNCMEGPTPTPCGVCERCVAADSGSDVDIVEIDAASNTGVDSVRALRDQAAYMPLKARYKIYIIDEVHMLSKAAFNALLKTLEEPPAHVKFLFATTEPHKVLDTILSRCQVLRLAPISERVISSRLREVFEREEIRAEDGVTSEIARLARGGMRDALSIADQLLALVGAEPKLEDLERMTREGASGGVDELIDRVLANDKPGVLAALPSTEGGESEYVETLLFALRAALVAAMCGEDSPLLAGESRPGELVARAKKIGADRLELWLAELLHARERMRLLPGQSRLILELALLDLCQPELSMPLGDLVKRLEQLEGRVGAPLADASASSQAISAEPRGRESAAHTAAASAVSARSEAAPPPSSSPKEIPRPAPPQSSAASRGSERESEAAVSRAPARAADSTARAVEATSTQAPREAAQAPRDAAQAPREATQASREKPTEPSPQPPAQSAPRPKRSPAAARAAASSSTDAWGGFLEELGAKAPSLAAVLQSRGKLMEFTEKRALIQLSNLRDKERAMIEDKRNRAGCAKIFSEVVGREVELILQDTAGVRRGAQDPYTKHVADLFGGRIEDEA